MLDVILSKTILHICLLYSLEPLPNNFYILTCCSLIAKLSVIHTIELCMAFYKFPDPMPSNHSWIISILA